MQKSYASIKEFKKDFFPRTYEEELMEKMSPEEFGRYIVEKSLEEFKRNLERSV